MWKSLQKLFSWLREATYVNNSSSYEDVDEDEWVNIDNLQDRNLDQATLTEQRKLSRLACLWNPHARNVIRNFVIFIVGKGFQYTPYKKGSSIVDPQLIQQIKVIWDTFETKNNWPIRTKEIVRRFYRDGEVFLRYFSTEKTLSVRFIDPDVVFDPSGQVSWGIETDPQDVETPTKYIVSIDGTTSTNIPAEEIQHIKAEDSDVKRGIPFLLPVLKRLRQYDAWIQDRITLNKIRSSIALIRKWNAGPSTIKSFADANATRTDIETHSEGQGQHRRQRFKPGSVIDVPKGAEYQYLSPDVQAADVRYDGRSIILSIAAGVGQPEYMVNADASNANYSSTMVAESPAVRSFEDGQEIFSVELMKVWRRTIQHAVQIGELPQEALQYDVVVTGLPLIARNHLQETQANQILFESKILSPQSWAAKEGINYEKVEQEWKAVMLDTLHVDNGESEENQM